MTSNNFKGFRFEVHFQNKTSQVTLKLTVKMTRKSRRNLDIIMTRLKQSSFKITNIFMQQRQERKKDLKEQGPEKVKFPVPYYNEEFIK